MCIHAIGGSYHTIRHVVINYAQVSIGLWCLGGQLFGVAFRWVVWGVGGFRVVMHMVRYLMAIKVDLLHA